MPKITSVDARLFRVPLKEVLSDAKHGDHTHFELITATVTLDNGASGTGYTYTGGWGGHAIVAMIEHDLTTFLLGKDAEDVEALHDGMRWHIHYVGRGGISAFAIEALTDLVYLELPEVGKNVNAGEAFGEIESVKAVSDLYCPVTGEVTEVNTDIKDSLETLSEDPYGAGWIIRMKVLDDAGLADLMDHTAYQKQCAEEEV